MKIDVYCCAEEDGGSDRDWLGKERRRSADEVGNETVGLRSASLYTGALS